MTPLSRDLILSIATEEAASVCAKLNDALGMQQSGTAILARRRSFERIMRETGCGPRELARLWGCDPCVIFRAKLIKTPPPSSYDASTAQRLQWAHGQERAASIIAGNDAATSADIAAWRSFGGPR